MKRLSLLLIFFVFAACQEQKAPQLIVQLIDPPVSKQSLTPNLFTSPEGDIFLSWMEKSDGLTKLKFSQLENDEWTNPKLISQGSNWFVNWADFPSLISNGETLSAHWLQKRAEGTYDYDVRISQSADNGITWSDSFIPHNDGIAAEHGFVSMLALSEEKNFATWLDGRNTKSEHAPSEHGHGGSGAMTLRAGFFDNQGEMTHDWQLDNRTCDCCQTSAAITSIGPIVAYRDRSEDETRDIYITRLEDNEWTTPKAVSNDNWKISGCPVNGPSITAKGNDVAIAWFTAAQGFSEVKMAISNDAGASFQNPTVISQGKTIGRVGIKYLSNGNIAMSWVEAEDDLAKIMLIVFDQNGQELVKQVIAETSAARASGFPILTENGEHMLLAWTESGDDLSQVRSARIQLTD